MKTRLPIYILVTVFLLLVNLSAGRREGDGIDYEIPSVTLTLLSDKPVTVGDPVDLAVTVYHRRGDTVLFPEREEDFAPLMLREFSSRKRNIGNGVVKTMALYKISAFQTGNVSLGPLTVTVAGEKLTTPPVTFSVLSVLPADEEDRELRDIVPPYRARLRTLSIILILLGAAAAFAAFVLLRRFFIRPRRAPKTIVQSEAVFDPYGYSLEQLESIRKAHEREVADSKRVYTTIAHSLKLFFGSLLSVQALEMTTSELKRYLKQHRTDYVQSNRLVSILHRSDLVKFAKEIPVRRKIDQDIDQSISIIKEAHTRAGGAAAEKEGESSDDI
jgi:hypothetical protein